MKSHEVLKRAIDRVGVKAIAAEMNLSTALIYKWCQECDRQDSDLNASGAVNPLDRLTEVYVQTKDVELIHWICRKADGYFVQNALIDEQTHDARIFKNTQKLIKQFSDTLEKISECFDNDNHISAKESESIRKEWEELKGIGEGFVYACELGKFNKSARKDKERN